MGGLLYASRPYGRLFSFRGSMKRQEKLEDYEGFLEKFKPKKTTDDCYTPPTVYQAVLDYVVERYGIDPGTAMRPYYPGGDYENEEYPEGCCVVDNPPFSILSKICAFYLSERIPFFLFAPSLTCFSGARMFMRMNHIVCDCDIEYENGAVVRTSFVTNMGVGCVVAESCPELSRRVNAEVERLKAKKTASLPKYEYPDNIVTAAMLMRYAKYGVALSVPKADCCHVGAMDEQRAHGKSIFGGGLLLSERAAAERAAAERAAAERAAAERAAAKVWKLSDREREIVSMLGRAES